MKHLNSIVVSICLGVFSVALLPSPASARQVLDVASLATIDDPSTAAARAEKVARIAEHLIETLNYDYADRVVDIAIDLDPHNFRSQLLRRYMDLAMRFRGVTYRMEKIASQLSKKDQDEYAAQVKRERADRRLRRFTLDTRLRPFETGEELRQFFKSTLAQIDEMAAFIKANEDKEISIQSPTQTFTPQGDIYIDCRIVESSPNVFVVETCPSWKDGSESKISKYDWQALRLDLIQTKWSMTLMLAYSFEDLEKIVIDVSNTPTDKLSVQSLTKIVQRSANFGKLVDRSSLDGLKALGDEATFVIRQLMQTDACKGGKPKPRPGYRVGGRCFKFEFPGFGPRYEESLAGPVEVNIELMKTFAFSNRLKSKIYVTEMDMRKILEGRVESLQTGLANDFDSCGRPKGLADPTVFGLFPRGDFFTVASGYDGITDGKTALNARCVKE